MYTFSKKLIYAVLAMATVIEASVPYPFFGNSFLPSAFSPVPAFASPVPAFAPPVPAFAPPAAFPLAPPAAFPLAPPAAFPVAPTFPAVPAALPVAPKFLRFAPPSVPPHVYSVNIVTRALTPPTPFLLPPFGVQGAQPLPAYNYWRR